MVSCTSVEVVGVDKYLTFDERTAQKSYWKENAVDASVEAMMLDSNATIIDREERPEVCTSREPV
jgi:phosphoethanolamine N-methyltransferase